MKATHKWYYFHFMLGVLTLIILTIFVPREVGGASDALSMYISMPVIVFMISFVNKLRSLAGCMALLIISKVINANLSDMTSVQTTIYGIQLFFTGIFWFTIVNVLVEVSETIWNFRFSFFKRVITLSIIIPLSYVLSLWLAELFLNGVGITEAMQIGIFDLAMNIGVNIIYCLVGTSSLLILSYPYLNNYLSKTVINRVFQNAEDYTIKDASKNVVRKNNRYWKVDDKMV